MSIALAAGELVKAALIDAAANASVQIQLPAEQHGPWSDCAFRGGRHSFVLICHDALSCAVWLALLPAFKPRVPGHRISDIAVPWVKVSCGLAIATIDVLTIEGE